MKGPTSARNMRALFAQSFLVVASVARTDEADRDDDYDVLVVARNENAARLRAFRKLRGAYPASFKHPWCWHIQRRVWLDA